MNKVENFPGMETTVGSGRAGQSRADHIRWLNRMKIKQKSLHLVTG